MQSGSAEAFVLESKKLEDGVKEIGLKIKHHEDNIEFLKAQKNRLDDSIFDIQDALDKILSVSGSGSKNKGSFNGRNEEETIQQILRYDKSAAGIYCQLKPHISRLPSMKDVMGIVALLGKVDDDNLSRILSVYLGRETMSALVCKTRGGLQTLETYDEGGFINNSYGVHRLGALMGRPLVDPFHVICLENLREVEIKFPKSSGRSNLPENYFDTESQTKELKWKRARFVEDLQREQALLDSAKHNFQIKKQEFIEFLHAKQP